MKKVVLYLIALLIAVAATSSVFAQNERIIRIPFNLALCGSHAYQPCDRAWKEAENECFRSGGNYTPADSTMSGFRVLICRIRENQGSTQTAPVPQGGASPSANHGDSGRQSDLDRALGVGGALLNIFGGRNSEPAPSTPPRDPQQEETDRLHQQIQAGMRAEAERNRQAWEKMQRENSRESMGDISIADAQCQRRIADRRDFRNCYDRILEDEISKRSSRCANQLYTYDAMNACRDYYKRVSDSFWCVKWKMEGANVRFQDAAAGCSSSAGVNVAEMQRGTDAWFSSGIGWVRRGQTSVSQVRPAADVSTAAAPTRASSTPAASAGSGLRFEEIQRRLEEAERICRASGGHPVESPGKFECKEAGEILVLGPDGNSFVPPTECLNVSRPKALTTGLPKCAKGTGMQEVVEVKNTCRQPVYWEMWFTDKESDDRPKNRSPKLHLGSGQDWAANGCSIQAGGVYFGCADSKQCMRPRQKKIPG